jgi:hypothetical protein
MSSEEGKVDEVKNIEIDAASPIAEEPARSPGMIAQLISLMRKFTVGQELTSNTLSMPEGFEGKDTGIERFQLASLRHSDILLKANETEDPVLRMIEVVKYIFTMGQAFLAKKPLNPVLGEVSVAKFYSNQPKAGNKNDGKYRKEEKEEKDVFYSLIEQVSHHPPKSAAFSENKERGITMKSFSKASVKFLGTAIKLALEGQAQITLAKFNEVYTYRPPSIMIRFIGFVLEYAGDIEITCSNQPYVARISYKEKPYLRGKYHKLKGKIVKKLEKGEEDVVKFSGHWDKEVQFDDLRDKKTYTFSAAEYPLGAGTPIYPPIEEDLPQSSRKVWYNLKNAPDSSSASKAKREVEEEQRRKAKERVEKGEVHKPKYFTEDESQGWKPNPGILESIKF